jgi:hypothetical protein
MLLLKTFSAVALHKTPLKYGQVVYSSKVIIRNDDKICKWRMSYLTIESLIVTQQSLNGD